jgi:fluoroacetyl-CoA thioesterase
MLNIGTTLELRRKVKEEYAASSLSTGTLRVFATPVMISFMEEASLKAVLPYLEDGQSTVGTLVNVEHVSPTPVGNEVRVVSTLTKIDRKKLVFEVRAYDEAGLIGQGIHERFIIDAKKFMDKVNAKQ